MVAGVILDLFVLIRSRNDKVLLVKLVCNVGFFHIFVTIIFLVTFIAVDD